jgi:hypothetical protein
MAVWAYPAALTALVPWWATVGLVAQSTTDSPSSGALAALATLLVQLGLSGVFLWQWMRADKERREKDAMLVELVRQVIPALEKSTDTLEVVQRGLSVQVERVAPRERQLGRVEDLLVELRDALGTTGPHDPSTP